MTNLIKRLREHDDPRLYHEADVLMSEAADHIAALEAENAEKLRIMQGRLEVAEAGFRRASERALLLEQRVGELAREAITRPYELRDPRQMALPELPARRDDE